MQKITKVILFILIAFSMGNGAKAGYVIFDGYDEISPADQKKIFTQLILPPFPEVEPIRQVHSNLRIEYLPDTAYQVLQSMVLKGGELRWDSYYGGRINNSNTHDFVPLTESSSARHMTDTLFKVFININKALTLLAKNTDGLIKIASTKLHDDVLNYESKMADGFLTKSLFERIIAIEADAFQKKHTLLWRFTYGLKNYLHWLDSVLIMTGTTEEIAANPKIYGANFNNNGLSYAVRLLDASFKVRMK